MPREQFIAPAGVAAGGPFFLLGFLPLGLPGWLGSAMLREPGILRPFFGQVPSESGRDLPRCNSLAFCDQNNRDGPPRMVGICCSATAWRFATVFRLNTV